MGLGLLLRKCHLFYCHYGLGVEVETTENGTVGTRAQKLLEKNEIMVDYFTVEGLFRGKKVHFFGKKRNLILKNWEN